MHSPAASHASTPVSTPAKPHHQDEHDDIPDPLPAKLPVLTNDFDFHLDTHFNPVWMSGPHVFSFAKDGIVVRPETYSPEPYPGYHARRPRRLESVSVSHFQGFSTQDKKPWKNVAITEQDDAEFAAIQGRVGGNVAHVGCERRRGSLQCSMPDGEEPEVVYTRPPTPGNGRYGDD